MVRSARAGDRASDGSPAEFERELYQPFVVVGRRETADVKLDHPDVSRSHAYLQVIAGHVFCVDLQSRTGIHWAGGRQPWGGLASGAAVQIGNNRIRPWGRVIRLQTGQLGANRPVVPDSRGFPVPTTRFSNSSIPWVDPWPGEWTAAIYLLGRSPSCKVHLPSTLCATIHASLVSTRTGIWVVDMRSTTGTLVNGETVRCIKLVDGDDLALGPYRLRIRRGPAVTQLLFHASLSGQTRLSGPGVDRSNARPPASTVVIPGFGVNLRGASRHGRLAPRVRSPTSRDEGTTPPGGRDVLPDAPGTVGFGHQ